MPRISDEFDSDLEDYNRRMEHLLNEISRRSILLNQTANNISEEPETSEVNSVSEDTINVSGSLNPFENFENYRPRIRDTNNSGIFNTLNRRIYSRRRLSQLQSAYENEIQELESLTPVYNPREYSRRPVSQNTFQEYFRNTRTDDNLLSRSYPEISLNPSSLIPISLGRRNAMTNFTRMLRERDNGVLSSSPSTPTERFLPETLRDSYEALSELKDITVETKLSDLIANSTVLINKSQETKF